MRTILARLTAPCLVLLAFSISACNSAGVHSSAADNSLANDAQALLDARLLEIRQAYPFAVERGVLKTAYLGAHGLLASTEARSRLDNAIDELVNGGIAMSLNSNPTVPRVHWLASGPHHWFGLDMPGSRWAFDNPDNAYRTVPISADASYVIHGHRFGNGPADVSFSLINDPVTQGTEAFLDGKQLAIDANGDYRITIDSEPANGRPNHLQSTDATQLLFIRSNLGDWSTDAHDSLKVEYLGEPGAELSDEEVARRTSNFLLKAAPVYGTALLGLKTMAKPANSFPQPSMVATPGALVTQANSFGHFRIADDECLLITLEPGGAEYFIVPVTDPWMVGVDPGRQTSLNQAQALPDADGRYSFVVSLSDPGVYNWLDAAGLHEGTLMIRWQRLPENGGHPALETRLLKLDELNSALPSSTPMISPETRRQQLQNRRSTYDSRFAVP